MSNKAKIDFSKSVQMLYPTPIIRHQFDDMDETNREIRELLLAKEKEFPEWRTGGPQKSNIAGWRSKDDLLTWQHSGINQIVKRLTDGVAFLNANRPIKNLKLNKSIELFGWANINRSGHYNVAHIHPGYHWGAVYYVTTGEPDPELSKNGVLDFHDPRPAAHAMSVPGYDFGHRISIKPKEGTLIIFPAWLTHEVHPFIGNGERISLAFNIRLK